MNSISNSKFQWVSVVIYFFVSCFLIACNDQPSMSQNNMPLDVEVKQADANQFEGFFSYEDKPEIIQFVYKNGGYQSVVYQVDEESCLQLNESRLIPDADAMSISDGLDIFTFDKQGEQLKQVQSGTRFLAPDSLSRIEALPDHCINRLLTLKGQAGYQFNPQLDFDIFWKRIRESYTDFELSETDWNAVYEHYKPMVNAVNDEEELFSLLSSAIQTLEDPHTYVVQGDASGGVGELLCDDNANQEASTSTKIGLIDRINNDFSEKNPDKFNLDIDFFTESELKLLNDNAEQQLALINAISQSYAADDVQIITQENTPATSSITYFTTKENVGYMEIPAMLGFTANIVGQCSSDASEDVRFINSALDNAFDKMQDTQGMILDLRRNEGGYAQVALSIMSRFIDTETHVYSRQSRRGNMRTPLKDVFVRPSGKSQYLKPVVILTSSDTFSAAEILALSMMARPNTYFLGEATGGGFSSPLISRLTSDIAFAFSYEIRISPNGEWFEYTGIAPDIDVPFASQQQIDQKRDYGIEAGIELLLEQ